MPGPDTASARRWTRFGHDRLYLDAPDGTRMGWADLQTGALHPGSPGCAASLAEAFAAWVASTGWDPGRPPVNTGPGSEGRALERPDPGTHPAPVYGPVGRALGATAGPARPAVGPAHDVRAHPSADPGPPWQDLAGTWPGASVRARADALDSAAPRRSWLSRLLGPPPADNSWRRGAVGEELVAEQLHRLRGRDPRWRLLHAVPVGSRGSDIDHVVMGPGGVYTLNAKHHRGADVWVGGDTVMVNGQRHPYVRNSRHEAARAARLLTDATGIPVVVQGVVVPVRAREVTVKAAPDDVAVVPAHRLVRWLLARPRVLDDHTLWVVSEIARRSTTWQPPHR